MRKRNILFLIPSLRGGGAERTLINLLNKVDYSKYNIDLIVVARYGRYLDEVPVEVDVHYLFRSIFLVRMLGFLQRTFNIEWFFKQKMKNIKKTYDVGISFLDSNYTDLLFFTDNIEKRVAFIHGSYLSHSNYEKFYKYDKYRKKVKLKRYSHLDGIYFVSHDSMSDFIELFGAFPEMGVVYNMIDRESVIKKSSLNSGLSQNKSFTFMAAGSLIPIKGFDRLIRASNIVRNNGYEFEVHIAGAGPEEKSLNLLIHEFNLEDTVKLHGFVKNPYPMMKNSDVFVMSSVSEALPTVLCEAMILGVPTLVTNCSGCKGLVGKGAFGLMADQDDLDYAKKMMRMIDDDQLRKFFAEKSIERSKLFDDERILKKYYEIFDHVT